ncbi:MAG: signal transduction histidine kinase [Bacteroidetes bacterium]|nr:MAG: signal transduction histidine kinase [Bacteroidota bacterium]
MHRKQQPIPVWILRCLFLVQLFCLGGLTAFAQQSRIDSLNRIIKAAKHDTAVAAAYVGLTELFYSSDPNTVIPISEKGLALIEENIGGTNKTEKASFLRSKADLVNNIGAVFLLRGKMDTALLYFEEVLKIYEEAGTPERTPITLNNIAVIYYKQGLIKKSLDYYQRSLQMREKLGDKAGVAQSLSNMGVVYTNLGQTEKALEYFEQSLKIRKKIGDKPGAAYSLNNIGAIYRSLGQMEKARTYYAECLEIYESLGIKVGIANTYNNIGSTYDANDPEKGLTYFEKSFSIYEAIGDKQGIANSSNSTAIALLKLDKKEEALRFATRALQAAQEGGFVESIRNAHFVLSRVDSALGKTAEALAHYKEFVTYRDSMANAATRKAGIEKQIQYEYDKKEAVLKSEQEEQLKRQKLINWFIGISLGLVLVLSLLLLNRFRLKQKHRYQQKLNQQQKEQAVAVMETQEQERKRIAEDLHDSLGHLLSTAKLHLQTLPDEQKPLVRASVQLLNQASEEMRNITFNLMPHALEEGGLVPALNELAAKVTSSGLVKVTLHVHHMDHLILEKQSQFNIYRIVQEAVNNILKHAEAKEINIQLVGQDDHLSIMIEDDGKGFDPGEKKSGRGLKNIVTRSLWLKGSINIDSSPGRGTTITTEIPV